MRIPLLDVQLKGPTQTVDVDLPRMENKPTMIMVRFTLINLNLERNYMYLLMRKNTLCLNCMICTIEKEMGFSLQQSEKYFVEREAKTTKDNNVILLRYAFSPPF